MTAGTGIGRGLALALAASWIGASYTLLAPRLLAQPRVDAQTHVGSILVAARRLPPSLRDRLAVQLARDYDLEPRGTWPLESLELDCFLYATLQRRGDPEDVVPRLERDHRVEMVAPIRRFSTLQETPLRPEAYRSLQHGPVALRIEEAHRSATGRGVVVAVVDTGVDINHPELSRRVTRIRNFVDWDQFAGDLHGTAVAGVIAADGLGMLGVAPGATVMALKACWHDDPRSIAASCTSYTLAQALDSAIVHEADIVNLSLVGPADPILERLLELAFERGIAVVAASDGSADGPGFPASHPGVIAVRAGDRAGALGDDKPGLRAGELVAPGIEVLTTVPGGRYDFLSGSSLAAAHVSGMLALVLEGRPGLDLDSLRVLIAADGEPGRLVDACTALSRALGRPACDLPTSGSR